MRESPPMTTTEEGIEGMEAHPEFSLLETVEQLKLEVPEEERERYEMVMQEAKTLEGKKGIMAQIGGKTVMKRALMGGLLFLSTLAAVGTPGRSEAAEADWTRIGTTIGGKVVDVYGQIRREQERTRQEEVRQSGQTQRKQMEEARRTSEAEARRVEALQREEVRKEIALNREATGLERELIRAKTQEKRDEVRVRLEEVKKKIEEIRSRRDIAKEGLKAKTSRRVEVDAEGQKARVGVEVGEEKAPLKAPEAAAPSAGGGTVEAADEQGL